MMIVVMLETAEGIANADGIAKVPGVDVVMIGSSDLSMELGIPGEFENEKMVQAYRQVIAACRKHGKWAGMGGVSLDKAAQRYIEMGCQMILAGMDLNFMMTGALQRAEFLRGCLSKT
jgi:4-hydroxy-2-oxoheptanedioate aldolase